MQNGAPESNPQTQPQLLQTAELISDTAQIVAAIQATLVRGPQTTEFWKFAIVLVVVVIATLRHDLPAEGGITAMTVVASIYGALRTWAKVATAGKLAAVATQSVLLEGEPPDPGLFITKSVYAPPASPDVNGATRTAQTVVPLLIAALLLTSCATNTGDPVKDRRGRVTNAVLGEAFNAVVKVGLSAGANALAGRNGQDAAAGIFEHATEINGAEAIAHVLQAYAGPEIQPVADVAKQQFQQIAPQTDAERVLVANTIAAAVQLAANQLSK